MSHGRRETRLATSIHEAGHAVAGLALDPPVYPDGMWIRRDADGWTGMVEGSARTQPYHADILSIASQTQESFKLWFDNAAQADVIEYLAGPVAEWRWRYRSRWMAQCQAIEAARFAECGENRPESDFGRVVARLRWLRVPNFREAFVQAWDEAERLLAREWRAVVGIGRALAQHHRLEADTVLELWAEHRRLPCGGEGD